MKGKYLDKEFLPSLVHTKISKTGQTRGADDDDIYQNRVKRNSTVLIPYEEYDNCRIAPTNDGIYENGFIVLIKPETFFNTSISQKIRIQGLKLGKNMLVFYETRDQWKKHPPLKSWKVASSRKAPLRGQYIARMPATTSAGENKIMEGFNTSSLKGAGIRVYEYADSQCIQKCKIQLEFLFWSCFDIMDYIHSMPSEQQTQCLTYLSQLKDRAQSLGLLDLQRLKTQRILDNNGHTICPLCLKPISVKEFLRRVQQASGREVPDLTVTEVSLFHIHELRSGEFNHRPYNLGWGHHHCNVVVRDAGIDATLAWMKDVLKNNGII